MADPSSRESATEARRRKILEKGQERLKHITFGSGSGSVARSLSFGEEGAPDRQPSLTPAASGLDPADGDREGAAVRSKSWLAMQESPPQSRKTSPDKSPVLRRNSTPQASPLAPAHSASLAPVSSPAAAYASDEEPVSPLVSRSGVSSGTRVSPSALQASRQTLPVPPSATGTPFASPLHTSQRDGSWAGYDSPGGATSEIQPAAKAKGACKQRQLASCSAKFQQALAASSALRAVLAAVCAVFFYADAPLFLASVWQQHNWNLLPGAALLQCVPPLAALVGLQLAVMLLAHLLWQPSEAPPSAAPQDWRLAVRELSPRLHAVLSFLVPLYQQLWQDVAIYIFTLALCTEVGAPRYHGHWHELHRFFGHCASLIPPQWRVAAGQWTL